MPKITNRRMVTLGLLAALFVGALDVTVVSTAMPRIIEDLSGLHLISWVFSIYTLTTCVATPIFGKLADLFGRKIVFAMGLALFVLGSILSGAALSMTALIWFRALQGIGAGALNPVIFTIVGDLYPGEQRGKMQGLFASVWSVAGLVGPLVGGYFVDNVSWRWIFYMNVPVGILSFALVFGFLHESFEKKANQIDYLGVLTFTIGISSLLYALLNGGVRYDWYSTPIIVLFAVTVLFLLVFILVESKAEEPMIPLSLFKNSVMNVSNLSGFLIFAITIGVTVYVPMWIQALLGHSATSSGLTLMPMSLTWALAANIAGKFMYRLGSKAFLVAGSLIVGAGCVWLYFLQMGSPYWYLVGIISVIGFGMGCITTPTIVLVQSAVGWQMRGIATATNSFMRSLGQTVGIAIFGTLFNSIVVNTSLSQQLAHGMHAVFVAILLIAVLNFIAVFFLPSHRKVMQQQVQTEN